MCLLCLCLRPVLAPIVCETLLGDKGAVLIQNFCANVVLPNAEAKSVLKESKLKRLYSDPVLRSKARRVELVKK